MVPFTQDVRYAARTLRKAPGVALAAVLALGLGIGATTAIFSLVDATLLRPLPFHEADRLVKLFERAPQHPRNQVALLNFQDWRDQSRSFASMAGASSGALTALSDGSGAMAETVAVQNVTPGFFEVLGIKPVAGRAFAPGETNDLPLVMLSERVWRNRFSSHASIVGGTVTLGGIPNTVIGIVPADFEILSRVDVWTLLPRGLTTQARRLHFLDVIARLGPGVTIDEARADLAVVAENIARVSPETNKGWGVTIEPLQRAIVSDELRRTSLVLGGGVLFILVMACANVANLLLARGLGRTRELAVRAALGGSRARIIRQLLTESLLLALTGGAVGVLLSWTMLRMSPSLIPPRTIPAGIVLAMDWRLTAFALALTCVASLASGVAPAWQATRVSLVEAMGAGRRASTGHGGRIRAALAVVQIAVALLLLTGAGLFVRTIVSLNHVAPGFRADRLLTLSVALPFYRYRTPDRWQQFYETVTRDAAALPGVRAASFVCCDVPLDGYSLGQSFEVAGDPPHDRANLPLAHLQLVGPRYFETMGISILEGRAFAETDAGRSTPVCIVNQEFARRYLPGRDPLAAAVNVTPLTMRASPPVSRQIVGVIGQVKLRPGEVEPAVEIYIPFEQNPWFTAKFVVRAAADNPMSLAQAIKAAIVRKDKDLTVTRVRTMEDVASEATAPPRFRAQLVGAFAALAIVLAGVGLVSVLSYSARQRAREFGIRMALGARRTDVVRLVLAQGLTLAGVGLMAGSASAIVLLRFVTTLLFGVEPFDPITFTGAAAVVALLTIVACAAPAVLAIRADPALTLRQD
jgi:predicted permease